MTRKKTTGSCCRYRLIACFLRGFRRSYRIPAIVFWAAGNALFVLFGRPFFRNRGARLAEQTRIWAAGLTSILGIEVRLYGVQDKKKNVTGLVVSNHTGYVDILTEAAAFGMRFTPKAEIRSWPVLGAYVQLSDPVWIDRTSPRKSADVLEEFRKTLREGIPLLVYPEGTSTDGRSGLKPFKSTSFETVVGTTLPVQPVLVFYRTEEDDVSPAWYGDMTLMPHLWKILGNGKTVCEIHLLEPYFVPAGADRKQIMNEIRSRMSEQYDLILARIRKEEESLSK